MDPNVPLTAIEPQPMSNSSSSYPMAPAPGPQPPPSNPEFGLKMGPENRIPEYPGMVDIPRPPLQTFSPETIPTAVDIRSLRTNCSYGLRDYMSLQRTGQGFDASTSQVDLQAQVRTQAARVLGDLRMLQSEVRHVAKMAENHRWRRWFIGGAVATFIPLVRRIFRRGSDEDSKVSSNDTEYAFRRSKSLLARIRDGVFGNGGLANVAFFVFAVLYVFQNEVSLRVAKTVQKKLRALCQKIEAGTAIIDDNDVKLLEGWRWRILMW